MSRHHRAQRWTTHSPKLRAALEAQLPLPCVECGGAVLREHTWHVAHRQAAAHGGAPTLANVGAAHAHCNLSSGGREGARVVNARRRSTTEGIRPW